MAKAPSESRIPTFGSRIPIPGKFRFLPTIALRPTGAEPANKDIGADKPPPEAVPPPTPAACNQTITVASAVDYRGDCTVTLDAGAVGATFLRGAAGAGPTLVVGAHDVGRRVSVGRAQTGTLRFVGEVRFAAGLWCGVELDVPVGKHDGCVKGVRYFACRPGCGVMAPAAKVTLVLDNKPPVCDTTFKKISADCSGPYSLLEVAACRAENSVNCNDALARAGDGAAADATVVLRAEQDLSSLVNPESASPVTDKRISRILSRNPAYSISDANTSIISPASDMSLWSLSVHSTPMADKKKPKKKPTDDNLISPEVTDVAVIKSLELTKTIYSPVLSPVHTPGLPKQNSFELDESLGILTSDQMTDLSTRVKKLKTPSSDDLKSIIVSKQIEKAVTKSINSPVLSPVHTPGFPKQNSFELDESLGILTPDQMIDFSTFIKHSKTPSSDDLKSILLSKQIEKAVAKSKSLENVDALPNDGSKSALNAITVTELNDETYSVSMKPCEDSISILTPDQMVDFSILIGNSKTPSMEDLKSFLSSKRSDKTISNSRTPSSENLGSLPHDGFRLPADLNPPAESKEEESSVQLTRPQSIDLKLPTESSTRSLKLSASIQAEMSSPNAVENSIIDFSLGLIEEDMLATGNQFSSIIDTTANLDLPLDSVSGDGKVEDFKSLSRSDQTPSPEDLPLDPIDPIKSVDLDLLEPNLLNPSTDSDTKTDVTKSTATTKTNSFITSVTSITSLDTGYQGDGEMSRPASRGADHSPMAHKPNNPALVNLQWQRAIARRQDPMTDSDFFTESDADIHEENAPKGDRRAQVIDGTLYGVNAQAAAAAQDIFIGNQEEMDSSGVFTDMELNNRADDFSDGERNRMDVVNEDKSPSDISTKTISENSQEIKVEEELDATLVNENQNPVPKPETVENASMDKPKSPTQSITSNSGTRKNPRTRTPLPKEEAPNKKFKMPKRNVTSKVKTMMEQKQNEIENQENRKPTRKTVGRWDAVMNKISKGDVDPKSKIRLKEVKSKVSTGIAGGLNTMNKRNDVRNSEDSPTTKSKIRRVRTRGESLAGVKQNNRTASSVHSSLSDLSVGVSTHSKQLPPHGPANRVTKKRDTVARCATPVTEVLTPGGHKPAPFGSSRNTSEKRIIRDLKKSPVPATAAEGKTLSGRLASTRRAATAPAHKPVAASKDQSRVTGVPPPKGGSPVRAQVLQEKAQAAHLLPHVKHSAKGVEALGVLVQYLVFNLDAFRTPGLKRELETIRSQWIRDKLELEETRMGYRRLEDAVSEQKALAAHNLEEERVKYRAEITELFEKHRRDVAQLNDNNTQERLELERRLQEENNELKCQLDAEIGNREHEISVRIEAYVSEHTYRLRELEQQNERLRQEHQIALEILREENECIRERLDERAALVEDLNELRFRNEKLKKEFAEKEKCLEEKLISAEDEIALLKEENKKILETFKSDTKDNKLQAALGRCTQLQDEVESLRTVLDLKLAELSELRRAHGELSQAAEELPAALLRAQSLQARVEDLEMQLERKTDIELQLTKENKRLQESYNQESKQKKRLSLHNEELQWKLKQNAEVVNAILQGQTPNRKSLHGSNQSLCDEMSYKTPTGSYLSRSYHTSSFNEKHHGTAHILERTLSFREKTNHFFKDSPSRKSESPNDRLSNKSDYFELDDSPPSSPKVKGVVEKSDSVSWVLDMDESPEVLASRMVRRAGSFRNVTPPKCTPTKSPASKRPRTKANNLSLSASAGAIVGPADKDDSRYRSKSVSLRDSQSPDACACHPGEYLSNSWHYSLRTSTPTKSGLEPIRSGTQLQNNPDLEHDSDVAISLPALPSEICRKKDPAAAAKPDSLPSLPSGDLLLLQSAFPKSSAGEAMISESNSEDECSSSTSERSPSASDTETSEEPAGDGDKCAQKHSKMQYDLFLLTESTTNSEAMDCSWSEELDV